MNESDADMKRVIGEMESHLRNIQMVLRGEINDKSIDALKTYVDRLVNTYGRVDT